MNVVNVDKAFGMFKDTFSPKIVGELNGQYVLLVKLEGDKVPWHIHQNEDEMFYVLDGTLDVLERDKVTTLNAGEFYIVPKGVEHRVIPKEFVKLMLFEPATISHTGDVKADITKTSYDSLET